MITRIAALFAPFLLCFACASSYTPAPDTMELRAKLRPDTARRIVLESIERKPGGLYSAGPSQGEPWDVKLDGTRLTYMNFSYPVPVGATMDYYGNVTAKTETPPGSYEVELTRLSKIRVVDNDGKEVTSAPVPGYAVWFYETNLKYGCVNVPPEKLDELLAALTYFSPEARLMRGMGL